MSIGRPPAGAVAITGAGGFIGSALTRKLAAAGRAVVGIDVEPSAESAVREAGGELEGAKAPGTAIEASTWPSGARHASALERSLSSRGGAPRPTAERASWGESPVELGEGLRLSADWARANGV